jgi:hypothetical protein
LLMAPQVQLGGKDKSGKVIKHEHWSTAEQLAVIDFRLSRRRIGPGERARWSRAFRAPSLQAVSGDAVSANGGIGLGRQAGSGAHWFRS